MKPTDSTPCALVTGASAGIGAAMAQAYAARGWRVVLVGRRAAALDATALACARAHGTSVPDPARLHIIVCDLRDVTAWREHVSVLIRVWGCPDIVVANAGISHGIDLAHADDLDAARDVMDTNWLAALATLSPFIAPMRARASGRLVGVASVAGVRGLPGHAAYCASKAALIRSLESLRGELRGSGVRVVTLSPGYVETAMTARNAFPMPFMLHPDAFARRALPAIDRGRAYATIPWPMALASKVLHVLPRWAFDAVFAGQARKPRR